MSLKIGVDIDGVISNFVKNFKIIVKEQYDIDLKENDIYVHDLYLVLGISKSEAYNLIIKCLSQNLELIDGAKTGMIQLYKEHEIFILTARPKELNGLTEKWLIKNNIPYHKLLHLDEGNKHEAGLNLDVIIEDNLVDVINLIDKTKMVLLYDHPWNRTLDVKGLIKRVYSWDEINTVIRKAQINQFQ